MENFWPRALSYAEPLGVILLVILLLLANKHLLLRFSGNKKPGKWLQRTISIALVTFGALIFIVTLPFDNGLKGQILTFLGIILSAGIALSSTTVLGNLIAGIMNNFMKRFGHGDLIHIGEFQGRVIEKSIFHTEIQLEDSNFMTIPHLYMAGHPVKLIRKSNTVISSSVSLGYNVPRAKIEDALKAAAEKTGLKDPYVYITALGDFSVTYKIHGFLADSGQFFTSQSMLNAAVMDALHAQHIEIVSPAFMNQRLVGDETFIPQPVQSQGHTQSAPNPERLIFDEAIKSEKLEKKKEFLDSVMEKQEALKHRLKETKDPEAEANIRAMIERNEAWMNKIKAQIDAEENEDHEH